MSSLIHIFLHTDSAMRRELWRTFLSTPSQRCYAETAELSPESPIDVVITDQPVDAAGLAALANAGGDRRTDAELLDAGRYDGGVIDIGVAETDSAEELSPQDPIINSTHVSLPADATARELKLAVLLVTQIVRLHRSSGVQHQLHQEYQQLAFQDPVTSIANRRAWDQELARRWDERLGSEGSLCLALLDIDQLKQVNDSLGHAEGDAVLRATAAALVGSIRDQDFAARLGGDEFGVLLEDIDPAAAARVVDRIRCSTSRYLATGASLSDELPVTTSAGFACAQAEETIDAIYQRADEALRAAKQSGRNRTVGGRE